MAEQGEAALVCWSCQHETRVPIPGTLTDEVYPDEGRLFFPRHKFSCPQCKAEDFAWLEFWEKEGEDG